VVYTVVTRYFSFCSFRKSTALLAFLTDCLRIDPRQRATGDELLASAFLAEHLDVPWCMQVLEQDRTVFHDSEISCSGMTAISLKQLVADLSSNPNSREDVSLLAAAVAKIR
jgi:hypothetical protein